MAEVNPLVLEIRKMALEITCPLCLNLLTEPILLPCKNIVCRKCVSPRLPYICTLCKMHHAYPDLRPAHYIEDILHICKCLQATSSSLVRHSASSNVQESTPPSALYINPGDHDKYKSEKRDSCPEGDMHINFREVLPSDIIEISKGNACDAVGPVEQSQSACHFFQEVRDSEDIDVHENFPLLGPVNSSTRFRNKRSKNLKTLERKKSQEERLSRQSMFDDASNWIVCGSALDREAKFLVKKFASMIGAQVVKSWHPTVTHVIAKTDGKGACKRTLKVLRAMLKGAWIVEIDWVKACLEARKLASEEFYEVSVVDHGSVGGPKRARVGAIENAPKLFHGLSFYLMGKLMSYEGDFLELISCAGGNVFQSERELLSCAGLPAIIVYSLYSCQEPETAEDLFQHLHRLSAARVGAQIVPHTWVMDSIACFVVQPY